MLGYYKGNGLAQAIFEPNHFPYNTPAFLKPTSFFTPTCPWRWNIQSVPKRRHIILKRWGITQKKAYRIFTFCMTSSRTQLRCLLNCIRKLKYKIFTVAQSCYFIFYKNLLCTCVPKVLEISGRWCRPILLSDVRTAVRFALLKPGY